MSRLSKIALGIAATLIIITSAALLWVLVLFDPSDHRDRIAGWINAQTGYEIALDGPIDFSLGFPSGGGIGLRLTLESAAVVSISGVAPSQPMMINRFALSISLHNLRKAFRGEGFKAEGDFDVSEVDIRSLTSGLDIDWSLFVPRAFRHAAGTGRFEFNEERLRLSDLDLVLARTPIRGVASVSNWRAAPALAFDLEIPALEMSHMLPIEQQSFFDGLILLNLPAFALASIDALGQLQIGSLRSGGILMTDVAIPLRSRAGVVVSSPITARLYGGSASIDSIMLTSPEGVSIGSIQRLENVAVGSALADLNLTDVVEATANLDMVLSLSGPDLASSMESLQGAILLESQSGRIKGIDVEKLIGQLARQDTSDDSWHGDQASTPINALVATAKIENGTAVNKDLAMQIANLDTRGYGRYDFDSEGINYRLLLSLAGSEVAKMLPPPLNSGLLVLPLQISGTRESPQMAIDMTTFLQMQFNHLMGGASPIKPPAKDPQVMVLAEKLRADIRERIATAHTR